jgi:hypothetical protein
VNLRRRSIRIGLTGAVIAVVGVVLAFVGDSVTAVAPPDQASALITLLWPLTKVWLSFGMPLAAGLICVALVLAPRDRPGSVHPSKNAAAARAR